MSDARIGAEFMVDKRRGYGVAVIGFGYVGTVLGVFLAEKGLNVLGVDADQGVVDRVSSGKPHFKEPAVTDLLTQFVASGRLRVTSSFNSVGEAEVVLITVGTPVGGNYSADLTALKSCVSSLVGFLRKGQLVILKSTIPPGTTRNLVAPMLRERGLEPGVDVFLSFSPERLAEGNAMDEVRRVPVVVSGINESSLRMAERFWRSVGLDTIPVSSLETAEMVKLADNVWIDVNIALANELARVCEAIGVNAMEVIHAANSLPKGGGKVNILTPGVGVGGSCLTKDPWFLVELARSKNIAIEIPPAARTVNDGVPSIIVETVASALSGGGASPGGSKVAVLGYAFKGRTSDTRNTPAKPIILGFKARGYTVSVFDPWVNPRTIEDECGVKPSGSLEECIEGAGAVVLLANHPEFEEAKLISNTRLPENAVIYDGWHTLHPEVVTGMGHDYYSPGYVVRRTWRQ
jgi:UDP-N-acetyl-D-mannosaminuronic acid dehydrogenase